MTMWTHGGVILRDTGPSRGYVSRPQVLDPEEDKKKREAIKKKLKKKRRAKKRVKRTYQKTVAAQEKVANRKDRLKVIPKISGRKS